jgi:hypothetical protein
MDLVAQSLVYPVTHVEYYFPPEPTKAELRPVLAANTLEARFEDLDRYVITASKGRDLKVDQADYIYWFGKSLDQAIRDVLNPKPKQAGQPAPVPPAIVQVNATRMLAIAAKSGAPTHFDTIYNLVNDPDCRPEILIYAIQAAENLFAAYDPLKRDTNSSFVHTIKDPEALKLAQALEAIVFRTRPYGPPPKQPGRTPAKTAAPPAAGKAAPPSNIKSDTKVDPKGKLKVEDKDGPKRIASEKASTPTAGQMEADILAADQVRTVHYFRRAAIRALAQIRFPQFSDANTQQTARPLLTLAKVAVGDPSLGMQPTNDEVAYAVLGLCNMYRVNELNNDVLCDVIAQGVVNFAMKKAANKDDKSIQWKRYSALLTAALVDWTKIPASQRNIRKIAELSSLLTDKVLGPLDKVGTLGQAPNLDAVARWREQNAITKWQLYSEAPNLVVKPGFVGAQ